MKKERIPSRKVITRTPFPASEKVYIQGKVHKDVKVAMRQISLTDTVHKLTGTVEKNPPVTVYDTSGAYTDPNVDIDITQGLEPIRAKWIAQRADTKQLRKISSSYGQERLNKSALDELRFPKLRAPLKAKKGKNLTQMH